MLFRGCAWSVLPLPLLPLLLLLLLLLVLALRATAIEQTESDRVEEIEGDDDFIRKLKAWRTQLYPSGPETVEPAIERLFAKKSATVWMTKQLEAKWLPVECRVVPIKLRKERTIYKGQRNKVYKVKDLLSHRHYAYKTFANPDEYTAEIAFLTFAHHRHLVRAHCVQYDAQDRRAGIVFELLTGPSSIAYAKQTASSADLQRISAQLLEAVAHMHWLGFVHADIKPENVLIAKNGDIKVIDFGFAIALPYYERFRGTPTTIAPELLNLVAGPVHEGIDWWAYGSTVAIWYGLALLDATHLSHKFAPLRIGRQGDARFGMVPVDFPKAVRQLVYVMLTPDPERRRFNTLPQLAYVKALPFFAPHSRDTASSGSA